MFVYHSSLDDLVFTRHIQHSSIFFLINTVFFGLQYEAFSIFSIFQREDIVFASWLHSGSLPEAIKRLLHASLSWVRAPTKPFISSFSYYRRWVQSMLGHLLTTPALKLWRSDWLMKITTPEDGNRESVDNSLGQLRGWQHDSRRIWAVESQLVVVVYIVILKHSTLRPITLCPWQCSSCFVIWNLCNSVQLCDFHFNVRQSGTKILW